MMDLLADLYVLVSQKLTELGHPPKHSEDLDRVLARYLNLTCRIPKRIAWELKISSRLVQRDLPLKPKNIRAGLEHFKRAAQAGDDLYPYLHDKIVHPDFRDHLLYDWGMYHFHLGLKVRPDGFVERTDEVLLAMAPPGGHTMYLIDVLPHDDSFTKQELLNIVEDNWPELLVDSTFEMAVGTEYEVKDEELALLRSCGVTPVLQTASGRVISSPGGGMTTAGTGLRNRDLNYAIRRWIRDLQRKAEAGREQLVAYFQENYALTSEDIDLVLRDFDPKIVVVERTTGVVVFESSELPFR